MDYFSNIAAHINLERTLQGVTHDRDKIVSRFADQLEQPSPAVAACFCMTPIQTLRLIYAANLEPAGLRGVMLLNSDPAGKLFPWFKTDPHLHEYWKVEVGTIKAMPSDLLKDLVEQVSAKCIHPDLAWLDQAAYRVLRYSGCRDEHELLRSTAEMTTLELREVTAEIQTILEQYPEL